MPTNKYELAKKINELEGLTNEEKSELLKLLRSQKKYGLVWEDKPEDAEQRMESEMPVLEEVPERAIISDDAEAPNHVLIEGDNLEALTVLSYTHTGKIDVIYIDPPYNTGNKDFVYNDSFVDKENGYRHSMWLSFMNKRLKIAKNLLSEKGVIFISIDDNEQAQLKMLCDEIFGEYNFISPIIWEKADSPRMDAKTVSSRHDFILVYAKNATLLPIHKLAISEIPAHYNKKDEQGRHYYLKPLRYMGNADSREDRPNMYYGIEAPDGTMVYPVRSDGSDGRWRWGKDKLEKEKGRLDFVKGKNGWSVYTRLYADNMSDVPVESIWYNKDVESNRQAIALIKQIFGSEKTFSNPKPIKLIQRTISIVGTLDSIVLDFFAGSGTTLHATMQQNSEDGGHRQCILVQCKEKDENKKDKQICERVTYERNRRVIQGYTTPKGEEVPGLTHNNLRYYKTKLLPRKQTVKNKRALVSASTDLLCIKNDVYTEQTCFAGRKLKPSCARYFDNGKTKMLVIYNELTVDAFAETIYHMDVEGKILIYVFSNTRYAYDDNFEDVLDKVELCALPAAIYDAYRNILPGENPMFEEPLAADANAEDMALGERNAEEQNQDEPNEGQLSFEFENE